MTLLSDLQFLLLFSPTCDIGLVVNSHSTGVAVSAPAFTDAKVAAIAVELLRLGTADGDASGTPGHIESEVKILQIISELFSKTTKTKYSPVTEIFLPDINVNIVSQPSVSLHL